MADHDNVIRFPTFERVDLDAELAALSKRLGAQRLGRYTSSTGSRLSSTRRRGPQRWPRGAMIDKTGRDPWRVDETVIDAARISTMFLGLDHNFLRPGPPVLFETMIFGGRLDHFQNGCATWDEAMHDKAVRLVGAHLRVVK